MADIWARKSIDDLQKEASGEHGNVTGEGGGLSRSLKLSSIIGLGVGALIGAGIFVLTGQAAAKFAGPAVIISFVVAGIVCACAGLCYSEMAACCPVAGSAYTYAYASMGEIIAWMIGWDLILEYALGATTVSISWSGYVQSFLDHVAWPIPKVLGSSPLKLDAHTHVWSTTGAYFNLPASLAVAAISVLLIFGVKESTRVNNIVVALKVLIVLLFIGVGIWYVKESNWVIAGKNPAGSFIPPNAGQFGEYGISGILRGAGLVFFAYIGFDAISTAAQEAEHPQRDMPLGILLSLLICTILYIAVSFVITGIMPFDKLDVDAPIAAGVEAIGIKWLVPIISLGAILGLTSVMIVLLLGQSRILYSMAHDGLLPKAASKVHPRFKTPYVVTAVIGAIMTVLAAVIPLELVSELVSIGTLVAFVVVCVCVLILRIREPDRERPFRTPFVFVIAPLGAIGALIVMAGLPLITWSGLIIWLSFGMLIYWFYGRHHSDVSD